MCCQWVPHAPGTPALTVGQQSLTKSQARQSRQLLEGYYINLSVEFIAPHAPSRCVDAGTDSLINGQGGRVAHRLFHILVLLHLLLPGSPFGYRTPFTPMC